MEKTLKELLTMAREQVIIPLQNSESLTKSRLKVREEYFSEVLQQIWEAGEEKFDDSDIFGSSLEVIYFLYCSPIQLVATIQDKKKLHEYWDFFLENYPDITFDGDITKFYEAVKTYANEND